MTTHVAASIGHDDQVLVERSKGGGTMLVRLGSLTVACTVEQAGALRDQLDDQLAGETR